MSLILLIETATSSCSVALAADNTILGFKQINERNIHATVITTFIDDVLLNAQVKLADVDAIAVSCGPGSYTGLRIGISTAKGLCYALDKPLIAVDTLSAMASGIVTAAGLQADDDILLCPMIDARRMEVYTAIFTAKGETVKGVTAEIIDEHSFAELLARKKILFFGDGAEKCQAVLGNNSNASFFPSFVNSAVYMAQLADRKFANQDFEDVAYFEPYYLKDFIAGKKAL